MHVQGGSQVSLHVFSWGGVVPGLVRGDDGDRSLDMFLGLNSGPGVSCLVHGWLAFVGVPGINSQ